jgi:hypothetical protein
LTLHSWPEIKLVDRNRLRNQHAAIALAKFYLQLNWNSS